MTGMEKAFSKAGKLSCPRDWLIGSNFSTRLTNDFFHFGLHCIGLIYFDGV